MLCSWRASSPGSAQRPSSSSSSSSVRACGGGAVFCPQTLPHHPHTAHAERGAEWMLRPRVTSGLGQSQDGSNIQVCRCCWLWPSLCRSVCPSVRVCLCGAYRRRQQPNDFRLMGLTFISATAPSRHATRLLLRGPRHDSPTAAGGRTPRHSYKVRHVQPSIVLIFSFH